MSASATIDTAENAFRLAGYLREGKKVLVMAPRRKGKTLLAGKVKARVDVDMVLVNTRAEKMTLGKPAHTYNELQEAEEGLVTNGKTLILEEPWFAEGAWLYAMQDGARLFIGTPTDEDISHVQDKFDVVERLGFD